MSTLNRLNDKCLSVSVVDLSIIVIQNALCLIRKVRFVISCLCHYNKRVISLATSFSTMQVFRLLIICLTNNDSSWIPTVSKDERVLLLVDCHKSAPTQFTVELCLFLQLLLDWQECGNGGFIDVFEERLPLIWFSIWSILAWVMWIIGVSLELTCNILRFLCAFHCLLVLLKLSGHVIGNELRYKMTICTVAICYCNEPFSSALRWFHCIWNTWRICEFLNENRVLIDLCATCSSNIASRSALSNLLDVKVASDFLRVSASMLRWRPFCMTVLILQAIYFAILLSIVHGHIMGLWIRFSNLCNVWHCIWL